MPVVFNYTYNFLILTNNSKFTFFSIVTGYAYIIPKLGNFGQQLLEFVYLRKRKNNFHNFNTQLFTVKQLKIFNLFTFIMKKQLFEKLFTFLFLLLLIFHCRCKKSDHVPSSVINQNKLIFSYYYNNTSDSKSEIWNINNDGTDMQKVNIDLPANVYIWSFPGPKISPDKKAILFNGYDRNINFNGISNIYSCNIDGSNLQKIISGDANTICYITDAYYENQQMKILYLKYINGNIETGNMELWKANYNGSNAQKINIDLPNNVSYWQQELPKISTDGKTIFFSGYPTGLRYTFTLYSCNIDGSNVKQVAIGDPGVYFTIGGTYTLQQQPKILFLKTQNISMQSIIIANLDGTNAQNINVSSQSYLLPDQNPVKISSDGKKLFFNSAQNGIYSCDIDGFNVKLILADKNNIYLGDTY